MQAVEPGDGLLGNGCLAFVLAGAADELPIAYAEAEVALCPLAAIASSREI